MSIMVSDAGAFKTATGLFASKDGAWHEVPLGGGTPAPASSVVQSAMSTGASVPAGGLSVALPAAPTVGNTMLLFVNAQSYEKVSAPVTGFTKIGGNAGEQGVYVYKRTVQAGDTGTATWKPKDAGYAAAISLVEVDKAAASTPTVTAGFPTQGAAFTPAVAVPAGGSALFFAALSGAAGAINALASDGTIIRSGSVATCYHAVFEKPSSGTQAAQVTWTGTASAGVFSALAVS